MRASLFLAALLLLPTAAMAEETICTPEFYFNSSEQPPVVIRIDVARAAGSRVTRIHLETGAYSEHFVGDEGNILTTGAMAVLNAGSQQKRIDFVALDPATANLLRISLIDEGLPFVRVQADGSVASGYCV